MKVLLFALSLLVPATCLADMTLVVRDGTKTMTIYIKGQKARLEYVEPTTPPRAVYELLDLQTKRQVVVGVASGRVVARAWEPAAEAEIIDGMFADQKIEIRATGQQRVVNGVACKEHRITLGGFLPREVTHCVADGIDTADFDRFRRAFDPVYVVLGPRVLSIPGMPMRTEIRILEDPSDLTIIEVIRLSREPLSDALFVIPVRSR